ncbi:MAG: hypothetical protein Kow0056_05140 [Coriobacteriia bacterium]
MTRYSYSRIDAFKQCPQKYELAYIRRVPKTGQGIEAFMGSRVHEALEWLYSAVSMGRVPEAGEVLERYRRSWDEGWTPEIRVVREEFTPQDYKAAGGKQIRDYYARYHPFDDGVTVGLEKRVEIDLGDGRSLMGYIDRLVKVADGAWEIHDYKTSRTLPTQEEADADRQLALYQIAVQRMYPEARDVTLVWHYLFFDEEVRSKRTPQELEALLAEVREDIAVIEQAQEFPTNVGTLCDWCDYRAACPAWKHEWELEQADQKTLEEDDDVALVERYARITGEARALEREKQEVREELLRRMRERGLEAMAGTEHRVRVSRTKKAVVPRPGDPARRELEELLKGAGLWDRFSTLDTRAAGGVLDDPAIPDDVRETARRYVTIEESETLRISRREG